jgi:hypothetical protein
MIGMVAGQHPRAESSVRGPDSHSSDNSVVSTTGQYQNVTGGWLPVTEAEHSDGIPSTDCTTRRRQEQPDVEPIGTGRGAGHRQQDAACNALPSVGGDRVLDRVRRHAPSLCLPHWKHAGNLHLEVAQRSWSM